ncbi:hypothetical protein FRC08_003882 [Ceratobasidium sp. 394]|nr:hypothetical protein FRC08_003882 [Ceratobasidium sp. 394]
MTQLRLGITPFSEVFLPTTSPERGCLPGTREYILSTVRNWIGDSSSSKVLWLTDIGGSGKSATARHVAWETTRRGQLLCSFFFRRDIAAQSNTSFVVCNLSHQLARLGEPIASTITDARDLHDSAETPLADAFHAVITDPLCRHPPKQPSFIIIDALDESGTRAERAEFLGAITREIPLLPASVKVLLTSKPEQDIEQALDQLSAETGEEEDADGYRRLTFDVYGEENRQDLKRFIQHAFEKIAESRRASGLVMPEIWPSPAQRRSLVTHANGLFLWAKIAADYVSGSPDPQAALEGLLAVTSRASPEAAIDALYGHILASAADSPGFSFKAYYDILEHLLASRVPTPLNEVNRKIGSNTYQTIRPLQALLPYDPVVSITHQSFRDYVQCDKKCEARFLVKGVRSATSPPPHPELYLRFPLPRLATIQAYPHAEHAAPDVGVQLDPTSISHHPVARGAFGDIYRARYTDGLEVAIKSLRIYNSPDAPRQHELEKSSVRELLIWSRLDHPNVLGLLGICVFGGEIGMVSEWMPNDNVREYVVKHPYVNKLALVADIVTGLKYLHCEQIVHGDLKGGNVMVSAAGTCRLVDFGLAKLSEESLGVSTTSAIGTARWMAPELVDPGHSDKAPLTYASDIYALGMTILEVMTGLPPFANYEREMRVLAAVGHGMIPERPSVEMAPGLSDAIWELLKDCWAFLPASRPIAVDVVARVLELSSMITS